MGSRDQILASVKKNQPTARPIPVLPVFEQQSGDYTVKFRSVLQSIAGKVHVVNSVRAAIMLIKQQFGSGGRKLSLLEAYTSFASLYDIKDDPRLLEDVEVAIIKGHFAVAENGAVWVTDDILPNRVLPFICQHLVAIVDFENIVPTIHDAYRRIGNSEYGFGIFIAGPSKTADTEQSLVLGAHGPKTMTVILFSE